MNDVKIVLVDDEAPVLEGLSVIIRKNFPELSIAATARTGREAVDRILDTRPQIALIDIHMPGMNGLEVIREVRQQFTSCIFILVTAYERFDIARDAFGLGVYSYLLKPVRQNKLVETIESALTVIQQQRRKDQRMEDSRTQLERGQRLLQYGLLSALTHHEPVEHLIPHYCELLGIREQGGRIILTELPAMPGDLERAHDQIEEQLQYRLRALGGVPDGHRRFYLIPMNQDFTIDLVQYTLSCGQQALQGWGVSQAILVGAGNYYPLSRLGQSAREAVDRLLSSKYDDTLQGGFEETYTLKRNDLLQATAKRRTELALQAWEALFSHLQTRYSTWPSPGLQTRVVQSFALILHTAEMPMANLSEEIYSNPDPESLLDWGRSRIRGIIDSMAFAKRYSPIITKVIEHLQSQYPNQISLEDAADFAGVSPSYLSRLFTEEVGSTFVEVLTGIRMEAAKVLLCEPGVSVKEVSYQVGYSDPNYFSRIFRKVTGVSPTEFSEGDHHD
ncbi:response regulator transcription factor [Spirochaeta lutea]|uniref:AraC family transcriptional regulator n=1 Tax=Spirochaeta lutea TaxID=1480694 RepID=A0A098QVD8_9SPIO|nr:helix-turn-helix domain-containing protein [Spirochaeta lutea]KGE71699.1 hypothetical protein DC28_10605 [Spirochaeta lutea]